MKLELLDQEKIFVIHDFLSSEECRDLIEKSETIGYETFTIEGEVVALFRNNARLIHDDPDLAQMLWERAETFMPAMIGKAGACGFNTRFRFYRYRGEEAFIAHHDGSVRVDDMESKLTFMVYLCDVKRGGETRFYGDDTNVTFSVHPECGKALIFDHVIVHEGVAVEEGVKYVLRTDVMYEAS